ncbi:MAG: hypothetical protein ACRCXZ_08085 [Patescibacteria group bacterium]
MNDGTKVEKKTVRADGDTMIEAENKLADIIRRNTPASYPDM